MHFIRDSLKMYEAGPLSTTLVAKSVGSVMTRYTILIGTDCTSIDQDSDKIARAE